MLEGAQKDEQLVDESWQKIEQGIDGVVTREVLHVPRDHGVITELYRPEWDPTGSPIVHIYQSRLFPGAIGAWSCHTRNVDRVFCNQGHLKVVLYDGREDSPTHGEVRELFIGETRPTFVVIPIGIWHGLQNLGPSDALVLNYPTHAYDYADPDHWRLPYNTDQIPYTWRQLGLRKDAR